MSKQRHVLKEYIRGRVGEITTPDSYYINNVKYHKDYFSGKPNTIVIDEFTDYDIYNLEQQLKDKLLPNL